MIVLPPSPALAVGSNRSIDVILSLVRSKVFGYLRDIRRWVVAMSRSRLGLYVLGRRSLFESCPEIQETWSKLIANGDKLELVSGEMWPTQRRVLQGSLYDVF
jgi:intron-binding protein aquarius